MHLSTLSISLTFPVFLNIRLRRCHIDYGYLFAIQRYYMNQSHVIRLIYLKRPWFLNIKKMMNYAHPWKSSALMLHARKHQSLRCGVMWMVQLAHACWINIGALGSADQKEMKFGSFSLLWKEFCQRQKSEFPDVFYRVTLGFFLKKTEKSRAMTANFLALVRATTETPLMFFR